MYMIVCHFVKNSENNKLTNGYFLCIRIRIIRISVPIYCGHLIPHIRFRQSYISIWILLLPVTKTSYYHLKYKNNIVICNFYYDGILKTWRAFIVKCTQYYGTVNMQRTIFCFANWKTTTQKHYFNNVKNSCVTLEKIRSKYLSIILTNNVSMSSASAHWTICPDAVKGCGFIFRHK